MTLTLPVESICSVLDCTSDEFLKFYNNDHLTACAVSESIIDHHCKSLCAADHRYHLDALLSAMLMHAPEPAGRRYVAVALYIAHRKGKETVVDLAKTTCSSLVVMFCSMPTEFEPTSGDTPTSETTVQHNEPSSQSKFKDLRAKESVSLVFPIFQSNGCQVAARESYHCAITNTFDEARVRTLEDNGEVQAIPDLAQRQMRAAPILPLAFTDLNRRGTINPEIKDVALTWDMLQSWTQIDVQELAKNGILSPENAIYMTLDEYYSFGQFRFYLDKETFPDTPNKYMARITRSSFRLSDGRDSSEVEFRTLMQPTVNPPNPKFLKVHAAFARVLNLSGAAKYFGQVAMNAEHNGTLLPNGETDFGLILSSKLALSLHSQAGSRSVGFCT